MKQKTKSKSRLKIALRLILLIFCGFVLGVNIYLANANSLVGNKLPTPFGYGAAVVLSGSMEPELSVGDLIVVRETSLFEKGDVVVYQDGSSLIVHRIIELDDDTITTKGDANTVADLPVPISRIKGKVKFSIPYVGKVVGFLKTPIGTIGMIVLAIALIEIPHRNEKKKDEAERQKILDEIDRLRKKE